MPDDKLKILYDAGSEQFNLGTFDEFTVKMQDEDKRKTLYDNLSEQYNLGTFEEYNTKISSSLGVTPSKPQVTPLVTPEVTPAIEEPVQKGYKFTKFGQIVPLMEGDDPDTVGGAFDRFTTNFVRELSLGRAGTKRVLDPAETTGEVVADVAGTLAGLAIPLAIPIGGTEFALGRLALKTPKLAKIFRLGIKTPKAGKAAER
ncbi:MAG: hypothetical protein KAQ85_09040, partial [Thermodesulfovibrionia bacterium]|nr:hypothetical protein [Thermodesulfovibrionia bacterium]